MKNFEQKFNYEGMLDSHISIMQVRVYIAQRNNNKTHVCIYDDYMYTVGRCMSEKKESVKLEVAVLMP